MTAAVLGKGTILRRGNGASPEVFAAIPEMLDIPQSPGSTRDRIDVTNHDSVGFDREYILGLADGNEITCLCNYTAHAQQTGLLTDKTNGTARNFQLYLPQLTVPETCDFTALVINVDKLTPINEAVKLSFTLKVTGQPIWTP